MRDPVEECPPKFISSTTAVFIATVLELNINVIFPWAFSTRPCDVWREEHLENTIVL